jgi:hypothetical protein
VLKLLPLVRRLPALVLVLVLVRRLPALVLVALTLALALKPLQTRNFYLGD